MRIISTILTLFILTLAVIATIGTSSKPALEVTFVNTSVIRTRISEETSLVSIIKPTAIQLFESSSNDDTLQTIVVEANKTQPKQLAEDDSKTLPTYIAEDYLASVTTQYVKSERLNIRTGPSTDYDIVGVLTLNEVVEVGKQVAQSNWVAVKTTTAKGFIHSDYLSTKKTNTETNVTDIAIEKQDPPVAPPKENDEPTSQEIEQPDQPPNNLANQLKTVANNDQIILVTTKTATSQRATIETFERTVQGSFTSVFKTSGFVGKNGLTTNKREGDGKTPAGKFSIGTAFGSQGNPGTSLSFRAIGEDDVWVDDSKSPHYNSWQSRKATQGEWTSAENMLIAPYRYGFVINYNTSRTPYLGSAIFFHVANNYTLGCVGTSEQNVIRILQWLNPAKSPVIIQTTEAGLTYY